MFAEMVPRGSSSSTSMRESVRADSACAANRTAPIRATDALARALSRRNRRRFMFCTSSVCQSSLFQIDRFLQRKIARGASHQERVVSRQQLPGILIDVEDRKIRRIYFDRNFLTFAAVEFDFTPPHQTLRRLSCAGGQYCVHLGNFRTRTDTSVRQLETQTDTLPGRHLEIGIAVSRVRQSIAEGKQNFFFFGVIPLVPDLKPFVVRDLECRQALDLQGRWLTSSAVSPAWDGADRRRSWGK